METIKELYDYNLQCIKDATELFQTIKHLNNPVVRYVRHIISDELEVVDDEIERLRYGIEHGRESVCDFRDGDFVADRHSIFLLKEYHKGYDEYPTVYAAYNRQNDDIFAINEDLRLYHGSNLEFATNSEKMTLLNKLTDKGYVWDSEKLKLSKINQV